MRSVPNFHFKSIGLPLFYRYAVLKRKQGRKGTDLVIKNVPMRFYNTQSFPVEYNKKHICKYEL